MAAPTIHWLVVGMVSQRPLPLSVQSSSWVTVRAPLPGSTVTLKVASSAPSGAVSPLPFPTRSRSLPSKRNDNDGGGRRWIVKPAVSVALPPSGLLTVTLRGPSVAFGVDHDGGRQACRGADVGRGDACAGAKADGCAALEVAPGHGHAQRLTADALLRADGAQRRWGDEGGVGGCAGAVGEAGADADLDAGGEGLGVRSGAKR